MHGTLYPAHFQIQQKITIQSEIWISRLSYHVGLIYDNSLPSPETNNLFWKWTRTQKATLAFQEFGMLSGSGKSTRHATSIRSLGAAKIWQIKRLFFHLMDPEQTIQLPCSVNNTCNTNLLKALLDSPTQAPHRSSKTIWQAPLLSSMLQLAETCSKRMVFPIVWCDISKTRLLQGYRKLLSNNFPQLPSPCRRSPSWGVSMTPCQATLPYWGQQIQ